MRFVKAGLAIEQANEGERRCFLLEEIIPESEGSFRKYLNNTSAVPCHFVDEDDNDRAKFLAFAQHVQYLKTKKRAYVADFQGPSEVLPDGERVCSMVLYLGGAALLTDPQILTSGCVTAHFIHFIFFFFAQLQILENSAIYLQKAISQRRLNLSRLTTSAIGSAEHLACPWIMNGMLSSNLNDTQNPLP
jgi:Alpha-kinase family